jgi:hypothetical protein
MLEEEEIAAALNAANEFLKKTYPKVPLLVSTDFLYFRRYSPDRRHLVFVPKTGVPKQTEMDLDTRIKMQCFRPLSFR